RHHDHDLHDRHRQLPRRLRRQTDQDQSRPGLLRLAAQPRRVPVHRLHQEPEEAPALSPLVFVWVGGALLLLLVAFLVLPRLFLERAQDRLARETLARDPDAWKLLTRADLVVGHYRRLPGILGLKAGALEFAGLYGETILIATDRIRRVTTGARLASGRLLLRREVLRLSRTGGEDVEFVLTLPAASACPSPLLLLPLAH